jgi:hypothetical protein
MRHAKAQRTRRRLNPAKWFGLYFLVVTSIVWLPVDGAIIAYRGFLAIGILVAMGGPAMLAFVVWYLRLPVSDDPARGAWDASLWTILRRRLSARRARRAVFGAARRRTK